MAYRLIADLERRGIPCWISSRDIEPGEDYQKSIVDALESAPAMVLLFSDHANNSKEIPREMAIASGKSKPVIPVRIEDVVPRDALAYSLTNAQFLDLFANFDDTMSRLADKLQRQILASQLELNQQPPASAPAPASASAAFRSVSGQSAAKTAAPAAPSKAGSRKGIYIGAGAAVLLVCIGGAAFTFNSEHATAPARQQAAAVTASPARTVAPLRRKAQSRQPSNRPHGQIPLHPYHPQVAWMSWWRRCVSSPQAIAVKRCRPARYWSSRSCRPRR
ncbi:hypothetical protein HA44_04105 [Mixta gaviniae]|nr:hypothetical protein HA44_04105 [Mixta gaviniae]